MQVIAAIGLLVDCLARFDIVSAKGRFQPNAEFETDKLLKW